MSRTPTAQQAAIVFAAILLVVGLAAAVLRPGEPGEGLEAASAGVAPNSDAATTDQETRPIGLAGDTGARPLALPTPSAEGSAPAIGSRDHSTHKGHDHAAPGATPPAAASDGNSASHDHSPTGTDPAANAADHDAAHEAAGSGSGSDSAAGHDMAGHNMGGTSNNTGGSSTGGSSTGGSSTGGHDMAGHNTGGTSNKPGGNDHGTVNGYHLHDFLTHATQVFGTKMLNPGQERFGGYEWVGPNEIKAWSSLTGLRPVTEQAITDVLKRNPNASGKDLERRVAKRLTELNDWEDLTRETQENMMLLSGVDIQAMDKNERENTNNHLQHSPLPFGDIQEVLSPDVTIDLRYTHTLDKKWTTAEHLGDGVFRIRMVSNNNNGSHTGHILGTFKVQLTAGTSVEDAKKVGNRMVKNRNNDDKLYLSDAARRILNGETPWLDFSHLTPEQKRAVYAGRTLANPGPSALSMAPAMETTTTTAAVQESTSTSEMMTSTTTAEDKATSTTAAPSTPPTVAPPTVAPPTVAPPTVAPPTSTSTDSGDTSSTTVASTD